MRIIPTPKLKIRRSSQYFSVHTHSKYSSNDAMPAVKDLVAKAVELGQPAMGLTDHGNMAGSVELYQECRKRGIKPFPGSEMYFVPDLAQYRLDYKDKTKKAERFHMGVLAYTSRGYENLVNLSTVSHQNHFHKPTLDFSILAELAENDRLEGLAVTTGCYFGYAVQSLIKRGEQAAKGYLATLAQWFPEVYVELQNHNIEHDEEWSDDKVADAMMSIADDMGLPCVITQDSHYLVPEDKEEHESLKRLVSFGPDADDAVFPGDGFHFADERWMRAHHHQARFERGIEGLQALLGKNTLSIPVLDDYHYSVPAVTLEPQKALEDRVWDELGRRELVIHEYMQQLKSELDVIKRSGMAGYLMLVAKVTDHMREEGIVFQTRGSAAGSLVCWLLGISNVDPIKWELVFERFLSSDRTKPPDIDLDIAHDKRDAVIDWINTQFVSHQIGSWARYSMDKEVDEKGSLLRRYLTRANQGLEGDDRIKPGDIPEAHYEELHSLSARKLYSGMGTNAAGVVITSSKAEFDRLVPLAYMSRGGFVSQYAKDDVEALGLVKLDVLGSKTLTVIQRCMELLDMTVDQLGDFPLTSKDAYGVIKSGATDGIFQLEGKSSRWGCKVLKPTAIQDTIGGMALFRPASMN